MEVIRCVTEKTSLSSGQAAEDGPSQRRAPKLSVPGVQGLSVPCSQGFLYTHCSCAALAASLFWGMSAAQHNEVEDAPGSSGWLGHFLGSLADVHLAPSELERCMLCHRI